MQQRAVPVSDIERELTAALMRLVQKDLAQRGFVIVRHDPTKRFFQYGVALNTRQLLYDVPQIGIVARPCTMREGVEAGMALIGRWVLPETALLTLTEDDGESGRRRIVRKAKEWLDRLRDRMALPAPTGAA